ncbi:MAG: YraN family protein [Candidatus Doudnabacteria bacterium]
MIDLGKAGERMVADDYIQKGYRLLEKNYIFPHGKQTGEIDLIFQKDQEIIFVEVKSRSNHKFGGPFEAVDFNKRRRLVRTAKLYLQLHPKFYDFSYRIDVAGVDVDNLTEPVIILVNAIDDID